MLRVKTAVALFVLAAGVASAQAVEKPEGLNEKVSYGVGMNLAQQWLAQGLEVDFDYLIAGMRHGLDGAEALLTKEEIGAAFQEMQAQMMNAAGAKNRAEGQAYLDANKAKEGVSVTESGLQYEVITEGDGSMPKATDRVTVHYRGTFIDGTVFDSSYDRDEPATFAVNGVIPGWTEALQMMKVGSKWNLAIPSSIAYGPQGYGGSIGPDTTLVFDVELLSIADGD